MSLQEHAERNRVVVRYRDGRMLKGYSLDFTPVKETFRLVSELPDDKGQTFEVRMADLKAIFFVKDYHGDRNHGEGPGFEEVDHSSLSGVMIKVTFFDGEVIRGKCLGYSKNRKGFFIFPIDRESNNERIYVVTDALFDVKVGEPAKV